LAQGGLTIENMYKERLSIPEVETIYSSACSVVEWKFDIKHPFHPQVRLFNLIQESVSCDGDTATHRRNLWKLERCYSVEAAEW
jgi:hypothetical protein